MTKSNQSNLEIALQVVQLQRNEQTQKVFDLQIEMNIMKIELDKIKEELEKYKKKV